MNEPLYSVDEINTIDLICFNLKMTCLLWGESILCVKMRAHLSFTFNERIKLNASNNQLNGIEIDIGREKKKMKNRQKKHRIQNRKTVIGDIYSMRIIIHFSECLHIDSKIQFDYCCSETLNNTVYEANI